MYDIQSTKTTVYLKLFSHVKTIPATYDKMLSKAMIGYTISESINNVGTFSIQIKDVLNLNNLVQPGDWVALWASSDPTLIDTNTIKGIRLIGQIDRPANNKQIGVDGKPQNTWIITCRDFSKMFESTQVYYNPYKTLDVDKRINALDLLVFGDQESIGNRSPSLYVKKYIDVMWGKKGIAQLYTPSLPHGLAVILGKGKELYNNVKFNIEPTMGYCSYLPMAFGQMITLWDMMKQASNYPFTEMFCTTINGKLEFTFRPAIYTIKNLFQQARKKAKSMKAHIVAYNLGLSDYERVNCVIVHGTSTLSQQIEMENAVNKGMQVDNTSVERYGLRKMEISTKFAHPKAGQKFEGASSTLIDYYRDLLKDYGFSKHKFLNGPITIIGDNSYRIGDWIKFSYKDVELIAKVEQVMEEWAWGNSIRCTLALSHGFKSDGTFYTGGLEDDTHSFYQTKG